MCLLCMCRPAKSSERDTREAARRARSPSRSPQALKRKRDSPVRCALEAAPQAALMDHSFQRMCRGTAWTICKGSIPATCQFSGPGSSTMRSAPFKQGANCDPSSVREAPPAVRERLVTFAGAAGIETTARPGAGAHQPHGSATTAAWTTGAEAVATRSHGTAGGTMTGGAGAARTGGGQGAMSAGAARMLSTRTAGGSCRLRLLSQLTGVLKPCVSATNPMSLEGRSAGSA